MQDLVELGLRTPVPAQHSVLKEVVDAFLNAMAQRPPGADDKDLAAFVEALKASRRDLALAETELEARRLAMRAARTCEQFLRHSQQYYVTRETELREMIEILLATASLLAGDSTEFSAQIRSTSDRFRNLAQLEDIRELKRKLNDEAASLQRVVEAKLKRDEESLATLAKRVQTLQSHLQRAEVQISLDPLTKIANRRSFEQSLSRLVKAARQAGTALSVAMLDVDHFKQINDTHGHPIGDRVLLCTAQWITGALRQTDVVARYGGEEFVAILPGAELLPAERRFQVVISQIAERNFEYDAGEALKSVRFTVSCGVAQLTGDESESDLIQRADQALYEAKRQGRNQVVSKKRSTLGGIFG